MTEIGIRPLARGEYDWALALNNSEVPHVSAHSTSTWPVLLEMAAQVPVVEIGGRPAGFAVLFLPGSAYASENYRWFGPRFPGFLYLDRIVIDGPARGRGLGRALYAAAMDFGRRAGVPILTCEVNERPPNPESMAFHEKLGFRALGRQETEGGSKAVVMLGIDL